MELHYTKPADYWDQALPVGNGRLGAMVFGGVRRERIQLNEEGLWSGGPQNRINPDCAGALAKIRALFLQGQVEEAQRLAVSDLSGTPYTQRMYQTLGNLWLDFFKKDGQDPDAPACGYRRGLDLERAVAWTRYERGGTLFERQVFASRPADCLVLRLTARGGGRMSFTCRLDRKRHMDFAGHTEDGTLLCGGDQHGIGWAVGLAVLSADGERETAGTRLTVRGVRDVTLILTAKTAVGCEARSGPENGGQSPGASDVLPDPGGTFEGPHRGSSGAF